MFKVFTFKSVAWLALLVAIAGVGTAEPALAKKKKMNVPGHWERSTDGGFEWVGKKSKKLKGVKPVVRDHRKGTDDGGVVVSNTPQDPIVRDHRNGASGGGVVVSQDPIVRDHRTEPVVRDHRKKPLPASN